MQLVNLETPHSFISEDLIDAIQSSQLDESKKILNDIKDYNTILRSFYLLSCRQTEIKNYLRSAIVYTDAISEITKRLFPEDPNYILESSLEFYCSLSYTKVNLDLLQPNPDDLNSPVVVSELSEAIDKGDLENAFKISKNLLTVIDSKAYFKDLLIEEATKFYIDSGKSIVFINSVGKAIELFEWQMIDELIWFALKFLTSNEFKFNQKQLPISDKEVNYSDYVLKAASEPGDNGNNLLFIGHARQIYKSVSVKYKEIWGYLSSFIQTKLDKLRIEDTIEIDSVNGDIIDFEKSLNMKDVDITMELVNQILKSEINIHEIFGTITFALVENGRFQHPEVVIYLNMARRLAGALDYPRNLLVYKSFISYIYSENLID